MDLFEYTLENENATNGLTGQVRYFVNDTFQPDVARDLLKAFDRMKVEEKARDDKVVCLSVGSSKMLINPPEFYSLSRTEQCQYITHELIHLADNNGNKKISYANKMLWVFFKRNKERSADISQIMVNKAGVSKKWINKNEVLPYLMNYDIKFEYLKPGSKEKLIRLIDKLDIFKPGCQLLKKRLGM